MNNVVVSVHLSYLRDRYSPPSPSLASLPSTFLHSLPSPVRTSALNIVLHVLSVQDPGVTAFLALEENHGGFFNQMPYLMQDAYSQILCRVSSGEIKEYEEPL